MNGPHLIPLRVLDIDNRGHFILCIDTKANNRLRVICIESKWS